MKKIYLIGAGGHCKSCIDVIESTKQFKIEGLFDLADNVGKKIGPYTIIGTDQNIKDYVNSDNEFLITLGQIKTPEVRMKVAVLLTQLNVKVATVISPRAYVSPTALIKAGTIVMHDALVNSYANVGLHCIINTKALIEHEATVEDFCHVSTGAVLNGNAYLQRESFLGSLAVTKEGFSCPPRSVLTAGVFHK